MITFSVLEPVFFCFCFELQCRTTESLNGVSVKVKPMSLFSYFSASTTSFNPFILELDLCVKPRKRVLTEKLDIFLLGQQIHLPFYFFFMCQHRSHYHLSTHV